MNADVATVVIAVLTLVLGLVIGYYKARSESDAKYVSKNDCAGCATKKDIAGHELNLEKGSEVFKQLLLTQVAMAKDIEALTKTFTRFHEEFTRLRERFEKEMRGDESTTKK